MTLEEVKRKYQTIRDKYEALKMLYQGEEEKVINLNSSRVLIDHFLNDLSEIN